MHSPFFASWKLAFSIDLAVSWERQDSSRHHAARPGALRSAIAL